MEKNTPFITPAGGILALLCFFLPWLKIDCSIKMWGEKLNSQIVTVSGFEIATKQQLNLITVALIAAVIIIGISLYMLKEQTPWKSRLPVLISSGVGLACLLIEYIHLNTGIDTPLGKITLKELEVTFQFGAFGTVIGFILSIIGVWNLSEPENSSDSQDETG